MKAPFPHNAAYLVYAIMMLSAYTAGACDNTPCGPGSSVFCPSGPGQEIGVAVGEVQPPGIPKRNAPVLCSRYRGPIANIEFPGRDRRTCCQQLQLHGPEAVSRHTNHCGLDAARSHCAGNANFDTFFARPSPSPSSSPKRVQVQIQFKFTRSWENRVFVSRRESHVSDGREEKEGHVSNRKEEKASRVSNGKGRNCVFDGGQETHVSDGRKQTRFSAIRRLQKGAFRQAHPDPNIHERFGCHRRHRGRVHDRGCVCKRRGR